ncbi:MAG: VanW family protein [Patescibacteria group bacterium]|nr:VanW family protein [Patescibacteria group bacterium]
MIEKTKEFLKEKKEKYRIPSWLVATLTVFLILLILGAGTTLALEQIYVGRFFPNISIGGVNVGGLSYDKAGQMVTEKVGKLEQEGVTFIYGERKVAVLPISVSTSDPDLSYKIYNVETEDILNQAFHFGRQGFFLANFWERLRTIFSRVNFIWINQVAEEELKKALKTNFGDLVSGARETNISYQNNQPEIVAGQAGEELDYESAIKQFKKQLRMGNLVAIELKKIQVEPKISLAAGEQLIPLMESVLNKESFFLTATITRSWLRQPLAKEWPILKEDVKKGLVLKWDEKQQKPYLGFDNAVFWEILKPLTAEIEVEAREPKIMMQNGRVVEFQASQAGIEIDLEKTLAQWEFNLLNLPKPRSVIYTKEIPVKNLTGDVNDLGIKEIVGVGQSNFSGSPKNRIHNIKTGAASLNGLIIAPAEEFSLNTALGEISGATGYLPELVIKGNKTVPEFGGGLCQIATTMFRVALDAGLPILERYPHAYRVVYYEPAGMDATIYSPHPDLRFKNDTGSNLLLQTRIEGNEITFEFWGTSDGRQVEVKKTTIYNITAPGPTKYVETEDLAVGVKKCTETAHNGAETDLERIVTMVDGTEKKENWHSLYRPWQAVCLIGVEKGTLSTTTEATISE